MRAKASGFILAVLALQLVPVAREFTGDRETMWPFLAWGMFRHSSEPPIETTVYRVLATTDRGARRVRSGDAGFDRYAFRRYYQVPIGQGDAAAARDLARRLELRWRTPVREIVVEEVSVTLSTEGLRERRSVRRIPGGS